MECRDSVRSVWSGVGKQEDVLGKDCISTSSPENISVRAGAPNWLWTVQNLFKRSWESIIRIPCNGNIGNGGRGDCRGRESE